MKAAKRITAGAAAVAVMIAVPAMGAGYLEVVPWGVINSPAPGTSSQHYAWVIDGTTSYHQLGTGSDTRITKVTDFATAPVATELMSQGAWSAATGKSTLTGFYGMGQVGNSLQFGDSSTDAVWRVDKADGTISSYISNATILAHQQIAHPDQTGASLLTSNAVTLTGEHVMYESTGDDILISTGEQSLTTLVTADQLTALQGNSSVSGGLGYDLAGSLYWGNSTNDAMYKRASDGTLSLVLSQADIIAATGATAAGFGDNYGEMADGLIYFYDTTSDSILSFDPGDPANTLATVLSEADLLGGPGAGDGVYEIGEYDGVLAFNLNGERGLYAIPEPASLTLLALGGLAVLRRRR
jgi:hypothetical protein